MINIRLTNSRRCNLSESSLRYMSLLVLVFVALLAARHVNASYNYATAYFNDSRCTQPLSVVAQYGVGSAGRNCPNQYDGKVANCCKNFVSLVMFVSCVFSYSVVTTRRLLVYSFRKVASMETGSTHKKVTQWWK
jgi:hypothetical protein